MPTLTAFAQTVTQAVNNASHVWLQPAPHFLKVSPNSFVTLSGRACRVVTLLLAALSKIFTAVEAVLVLETY